MRATAGFLSRAEVAKLRFPAGFLDAVRSHLARMRGESMRAIILTRAARASVTYFDSALPPSLLSRRRRRDLGATRSHPAARHLRGTDRPQTPPRARPPFPRSQSRPPRLTRCREPQSQVGRLRSRMFLGIATQTASERRRHRGIASSGCKSFSANVARDARVQAARPRAGLSRVAIWSVRPRTSIVSKASSSAGEVAVTAPSLFYLVHAFDAELRISLPEKPYQVVLDLLERGHLRSRRGNSEWLSGNAPHRRNERRRSLHTGRLRSSRAARNHRGSMSFPGIRETFRRRGWARMPSGRSLRSACDGRKRMPMMIETGMYR